MCAGFARDVARNNAVRCGLRALELATGEYALDEHNAVPVIRRELLVRERDAAAERGPQRHGGTSARDDQENHSANQELSLQQHILQPYVAALNQSKIHHMR